jgi:hypothetical protein
MSVFFAEKITATAAASGGAKVPAMIERIFANRPPQKITELFAAAATAGSGNYIPIATVDEALRDIEDIEKRLVIKSQLRQLGAIA